MADNVEDENWVCSIHPKSLPNSDDDVNCCVRDCCYVALHKTFCVENIEHLYCCRHSTFSEHCDICYEIGCTICETLIIDGEINDDNHQKYNHYNFCINCHISPYSLKTFYSQAIYDEFKDMNQPPKIVIKPFSFFTSSEITSDIILLIYLERCIKKGWLKKNEHSYEINVHDILSMDNRNRCIECVTDMGDSNPRQLCGKTRCLAN